MNKPSSSSSSSSTSSSKITNKRLNRNENTSTIQSNIALNALYLTSGIYQFVRRHISTLRNECRRRLQTLQNKNDSILSASSSSSPSPSSSSSSNEGFKEQQRALLDRQHRQRYNRQNHHHDDDDEINRRQMNRLLTKILVILLFGIVLCTFLLLTSYLLVNSNNNQLNSDHFELSSKHHRKPGIHVVVGQFLGRGYPWNTEPNLTSDERDTNGYAPIPGAGENGSPVYVPPSMRSRASQLFFVNRFNLIASDMISVNRTLPDARKLACRRIRYPELNTLPNTTVIIVFHNEAWSTLVRTVHSVINRSPYELLSEIILVDDASNRTFLGSNLDNYFDKLSKQTRISIRLLRSAERIGLINARILGANNARGEVLTFLDAHVETTIGWLEPLLSRIRDDRRTVICPVIDIINDQTFAYAKSFDLHWGAMNWALNFRWFSVGQREIKALRMKQATNPFRTPIMAGGLFSIDRKYFFEMGEYDRQQRIWGGENIEMSLRIWQCGGRVEIAPCSHVAHLFRSSSPYSFGTNDDDKVANVLFRNLIRVVEVWLDEWKHFYYRLNPSAYQFLTSSTTNKTEVFQNIDERRELRQKLKCKSFAWYLDNVWPETFFPTHSRYFGQIKSLSTGNCIQSPGTGRNPTGKLRMFQCSIEPYTPQNFVIPFPVALSQLSDHRPSLGSDYIRSDESVCFDSSEPQEGSSVSLIACGEFRRQLWTIVSLSKQSNISIIQIRHANTGLCITLDKHSTFLHLSSCQITNIKQQWTIVNIDWDKALL